MLLPFKKSMKKRLFHPDYTVIQLDKKGAGFGAVKMEMDGSVEVCREFGYYVPVGVMDFCFAVRNHVNFRFFSCDCVKFDDDWLIS